MNDLVQSGMMKGRPHQALLDDVGYVNVLYDTPNAIRNIQKRDPALYEKLESRHRLRIIDRTTHNQMQSAFTKPGYARAFCRIAKPKWEELVWANFLAEVSLAASKASEEHARQLDELRAWSWPRCESAVMLEERSIDVRITMNLQISWPDSLLTIPFRDLPQALRCPGEKDTLTVEIKPVVRNDWSEVLRQMHFLKEDYLFLESYEGTDVPAEDFVRNFECSGKTVVFKDDVDREYDRLMGTGEYSATIH